jgi:hypothetical protein
MFEISIWEVLIAIVLIGAIFQGFRARDRIVGEDTGQIDDLPQPGPGVSARIWSGARAASQLAPIRFFGKILVLLLWVLPFVALALLIMRYWAPTTQWLASQGYTVAWLSTVSVPSGADITAFYERNQVPAHVIGGVLLFLLIASLFGFRRVIATAIVLLLVGGGAYMLLPKLSEITLPKFVVEHRSTTQEKPSQYAAATPSPGRVVRTTTDADCGTVITAELHKGEKLVHAAVCGAHREVLLSGCVTLTYRNAVKKNYCAGDPEPQGPDNLANAVATSDGLTVYKLYLLRLSPTYASAPPVQITPNCPWCRRY